jgi:hypothetical protein
MISKKYILLLLVVFSINVFGQFQNYKHILGPSIGFSFLGSSVQLGLNHEYGIALTDNGDLGIGGVFRYWSYSEEFPAVKWSYSNVLLGLQANYHFILKNTNFDPWAGLIFAYDIRSANKEILIQSVNFHNSDDGGFWIGAQAGARYWVNNQIAFNFRIGFGTLSYSALDIGLDYTFGE